MSTPTTRFQIPLLVNSGATEHLFISIYPSSGLQKVGWSAAVSHFRLPDRQAPFSSCTSCSKKQKSHRQVASGGGILELLVMILEYLAPGARRRTHTAGTTEASLLSLLDVEIHLMRVQKWALEVNV
jgi:hypothetical protein